MESPNNKHIGDCTLVRSKELEFLSDLGYVNRLWLVAKFIWLRLTSNLQELISRKLHIGIFRHHNCAKLYTVQKFMIRPCKLNYLFIIHLFQGNRGYYEALLQLYSIIIMRIREHILFFQVWGHPHGSTHTHTHKYTNRVILR